MKMNSWIAWVLVLAMIPPLAATSGCGGSDTSASTDTTKTDTASKESSDDKKDGKAAKTEEAVPVEVVELSRGSIESVLRFSANLEAEDSVGVFSQAMRQVTALHVEEGDRVRRGQQLLRLQDDEQRSALAKVESQLAKAEREYEQQERLFKQEMISQQAYDNATHEVEQLRLQLEDAERELGYTEVRAPISGTITSRLVNLGDQVQISQHLFDIVDFDSIVARIFVPEKHLGELKPGLPARVHAPASRVDAYRASVKRVSPVVDPRSGTVKVTVGIGGQSGLRPGMYVDVDLVTATHEGAVLVPKRALVYDDDQMFVYRMRADEDRRVERVFFSPALADKNWVEPLDALALGDRIVVAGQAALKDGALVRLPGDPKPSDEKDDDKDKDDPAVVEQASL